MEGKRRKKLFIIGGVLRVADVLHSLGFESRLTSRRKSILWEKKTKEEEKKKSRARVKVDGSRRAFRALNPPVHS